MRHASFNSSRYLQIAKCLALIFVLVTISGCADQATGVKLADAGSMTANTLADFYKSLILDRLDTLEIAVFTNALDGGTIDETRRLQELAFREVAALQHREQLAHQMTSTYDALKNLSSYDASGEVKQAVQNLVGQLMKTPALRGPVDPSSLFGSLAGEVAAWQQSRDIRKGIELLLSNLEKFAVLFEREKPAYNSIAKERGDLIVQVYQRVLIARGQLQLWPEVREMVDKLDLPTSVSDPQTAEAYKQLVQVRVRRIWVLSENAADNTGQAISQLVSSHRSFANGKGANLSEIIAFLKKAQSYLDEIAKLRKKQ